MIAYILLIIGGILYTLGDILCLKWLDGIQARGLQYWVMVVAYMSGCLFLIESFKHMHIAVASVIIIVINVILLVVISAIFFNKPITYTQMIGVGFAIVSMFLLK